MLAPPFSLRSAHNGKRCDGVSSRLRELRSCCHSAGKRCCTVEGDLWSLPHSVHFSATYFSPARAHGVTTVDFMAVMPVAWLLRPSCPSHRIRCGLRQFEDLGVNLHLAVLTGVIAHSLLVFAQKIVPIATISMIGGPTGTVDISCMGISRRPSRQTGSRHGIGHHWFDPRRITRRRSMENTELPRSCRYVTASTRKKGCAFS